MGKIDNIELSPKISTLLTSSFFLMGDMNKMILITLLTLNFNNLHAQETGRPAKYKLSTWEKMMEEENGKWEKRYGENVTNKNNGLTDVEIIFEDQEKKIFFKSVNLDNFIVLKGKKKLPKYLKHYVDDYKIILIPLEADYIIKYKNFTIESNNGKLYLNNSEISNSVTIDNKKIHYGGIMYWEEPIRTLKSQSLSCKNKKLQIDEKNKNSIFEDRYSTKLEKVEYGKNDSYPIVNITFKDQAKVIFFESLDIDNMIFFKGDKKEYSKYLRRHKGYNIVHLELTNDYIIKNKKYTIESRKNQVFLNNQEVCTNIVVSKDGSLKYNVFDLREQQGRLMWKD